jgi:very-short-patch-repair endonuclease
MPEIIRFSNDLCYSDTPLIPLRQYGQNRLPPLEHVLVNDGFRRGSGNRVVNEPEADKIVERICAMCNDRRYDGKTIGVVVLQGEAQADLTEKKLLDRLGAEEIERRQLICGNPYSFQGDERDIILLSMVVANNERIGALTKPEFERRFNVAASRARDQMILFHSVTCNDLSSNDLRRKLLEFFEDAKPRQIAGTGLTLSDLELKAAKGNRNIIKPPEPFDSWFEVDVALEILRKRYVVYPQYKIANKRIDLVIVGDRACLAVECDGDRWHSGENFESDMQRQRQLERCGWEFFRIRESAFYTDKNRSLEKLWPMLKERGILPN